MTAGGREFQVPSSSTAVFTMEWPIAGARPAAAGVSDVGWRWWRDVDRSIALQPGQQVTCDDDDDDDDDDVKVYYWIKQTTSDLTWMLSLTTTLHYTSLHFTELWWLFNSETCRQTTPSWQTDRQTDRLWYSAGWWTLWLWHESIGLQISDFNLLALSTCICCVLLLRDMCSYSQLGLYQLIDALQLRLITAGCTIIIISLFQTDRQTANGTVLGGERCD